VAEPRSGRTKSTRFTVLTMVQNTGEQAFVKQDTEFGVHPLAQKGAAVDPEHRTSPVRLGTRWRGRAGPRLCRDGRKAGSLAAHLRATLANRHQTIVTGR